MRATTKNQLSGADSDIYKYNFYGSLNKNNKYINSHFHLYFVFCSDAKPILNEKLFDVFSGF